MAKRTRTIKKKRKQKNLSPIFFALFLAIAVLTVLVLEYRDYQNGKDSFLFGKTKTPTTSSIRHADFNKKLVQALNGQKASFEQFKDPDGKYHFKLNVHHSKFNRLISRINKTCSQSGAKLDLVEVQRVGTKSLMLYKIKFAKKVSHIILVTRVEKVDPEKSPTRPPEVKTHKPPQKKETKPAKKTSSSSQPRVAFIIDDIGEYNIGALELKKLNIPITASILPDSPYASEEAYWASKYGLETLLHIPMQPRNGNGNNYGSQKTVTLNSTEQDIRSLIRRAKDIIPHAKGMNNHTGSLATSSDHIMRMVLKIAKAENLYFIDSKTTASTVGYELAKNMGIKTAIRDVFLDDGEKTYANSVKEIKRLVDKALQNGSAIAIGHPHATTIRAIKDSIPFIRAKGVEICFASELLH